MIACRKCRFVNSTVQIGPVARGRSAGSRDEPLPPARRGGLERPDARRLARRGHRSFPWRALNGTRGARGALARRPVDWLGQGREVDLGRLDEKAALVTGAGSGIGRAAARLFAGEGARIAVADIAPEGGEATVAAIREAGGEAIFIETDVTEPD